MSSKRKIGITGAEGTIGSILRNGLRDEYAVKAFTKDPSDFESTAVDLSSSTQVEGVFDGLDALIHLAASPSTRDKWELVLKNNIIASQIVFEEAIRAGVKKIVFASSGHTQHGFHMKDKSPIETDASITSKSKADDPPYPDSYYGVSKLFGENLGRYLTLFHDIQFVALRIGCATPANDPHAFDKFNNSNHLYSLHLSHRDCVEAFRRALEVDSQFLVAYATSDNSKHGIFDLAETKAKLGFYPKDSTDLI